MNESAGASWKSIVRWPRASLKPVCLGIAAGAIACWASASLAGNGATATPAPAVAKPSNLQVLPGDLSLIEVVQLMTRYGQDLGVQCTFCHVQHPGTQVIDFASDENPAKQTARIMIGMVRDINEKYLAQVSDRRYAVPVSCGNCHQGQTFPPRYEPRNP